MRSPARRSRCWASASAAFRVTVSASARLSPRCGTRSETADPRRSGQPHRQVVGVGGQGGDQDLPGHRGRPVVGGAAAVELQQERSTPADGITAAPNSSPVPASASTSTIQPRCPRTRPPRTWNTCTDACRSSATMPTTSASVPSPSTTACFSTARRSARQVVAQPRRLLEVQVAGGGGHLPLQPSDQRIGLARHEVAEAVDDLAVLRLRSPGRRTVPSTCRCSRAGTACRSGPSA